MKSRRWVIAAVVVLVIAAISAGTYWYIARRGGQSLLTRAEVALRAGQIDKALAYSKQYVREHPDDWTGRYERARVLLRAGRFGRARDELTVARELDGNSTMTELLMARTWSLPARRDLRSQKDPNAETLRGALKQFVRAGEILDALAAKRNPTPAGVREARGTNHYYRARVLSHLGDQLREQAELAAAAREESRAKQLEQDAADADRRAEKLFASGRDLLLAVVKETPSRASAGTLLVELCVTAEDWNTLTDLESVLDRPGHPAAETEVAMWEQLVRRLDPESPAGKKQLTSAASSLDGILANHPKMKRARLTRARVAILQDDIAAARKHCDILLKQDKDDRLGRLLHGQILRIEGKLAQAERELYSLKANYANWLAAQMMYAHVASEAGYPDRARSALRAATRIAPSYGEARRRLGEYLLREGFYAEAFDEARVYHRAAPSEPEAIRLLAATAARAGVPDRARKQLDEAQKRWSDRPDVLLAVAEGYGAIGDAARAGQVVRGVAKLSAETASARLAVARAIAMSGNLAEALSLLESELEQRPSQPDVLFHLARVHAARGNVLKSLECYRRALQADPQNSEYALALAQALLDQGELDECAAVVQSLPAAHAKADLLRLQLQMRRGLPTKADDLARQVEEGRRQGLPLALVHLRNGQPARCAAICRIELNKHPEDVNTLVLLGQAELAMGETDACIEHWSKALSLRPERFTAYLRLGEVLARDKSIDQVSRTLSAVPGASEDLVTLTAGALLARSGEHDRAAARLARLVDDHSAPDYLRGRAGLLRAGSLATDGQTEQAIRQLKQIESIDVWRAEAILAHARLLYSAGQRAAAGRRLNELLEQAGQKEDAKTLRRLAQLALAVRETGIALAAAEQVARIDAKDPQSHLQLARVHLVRGDVEKLEAACRAAVAARPGSIRAQLALAEALDYQAKRAEALGVLEEMEPQGRANRTASLLEQGALLRRWGLIQPAMERYAQLEELGYGRSPRLQLALGRMYFVLGREDKARQTLLRVPKYAPQFIPARQLIAEMADTPTEKLDALAELAKTHPDEPALTMHRMSVLVQSRQSKDAAAAFRTLMDSPHGASVSGSAAMVAVRAMVDANQLDQARTTCMQMVERSPRPEWRYLSILLAMEDKPVLASELLKKARRPGQADVLLGLAMGGLADDPNQVGRWWKQFETIRDGGRPEGSRFSPQAVLAALVGKPDYGTELAETFDSPATYREWIARELAQATRAGQADRGEAAALLRGELARGLGLPQAARKWAMEVLRARPSSQWAAALAFHTSGEPSQRRRVVQLLRPAKAPLAVQLRASLLVEEGKFAQAAKLYRQLAKSHPKQVDLRMGHASAVESAGELAEAMELYQDVWEELGHGLAANNAAYLMAVLHPKDTARLEKAWGLARKTVETYPRAPAFLDTAGWLAHLRGDHRQAIVYLTRAVKGWPKVPDIHYHLGMAERAGGSKRLGEWHLRAAVELGRRLGEQGTPLSSQTRQAVLRAEQELK